jgi:hypothetical protein
MWDTIEVNPPDENWESDYSTTSIGMSDNSRKTIGFRR